MNTESVSIAIKAIPAKIKRDILEEALIAKLTITPEYIVAKVREAGHNGIADFVEATLEIAKRQN